MIKATINVIVVGNVIIDNVAMAEMNCAVNESKLAKDAHALLFSDVTRA